MTSERAPEHAPRWSGVVLIGLAAAVSEALATSSLLRAGAGDLSLAWHAQPIAVIALVGVPLLATILAALVARSGTGPERPAPAVRPESLSKPDDAALQLLALLQQEGRFVDFVEEDLSAYPNEQIGAAVRAIHEGCRTALRERLALAPILTGGEGASITIERGFDPAAVRITGNVRGEPPYHGVLRHPGWRSNGLKLPDRTGGYDASILAPAEVEVL